MPIFTSFFTLFPCHDCYIKIREGIRLKTDFKNHETTYIASTNMLLRLEWSQIDVQHLENTVMEEMLQNLTSKNLDGCNPFDNIPFEIYEIITSYLDYYNVTSFACTCQSISHFIQEIIRIRAPEKQKLYRNQRANGTNRTKLAFLLMQQAKKFGLDFGILFDDNISTECYEGDDETMNLLRTKSDLCIDVRTAREFELITDTHLQKYCAFATYLTNEFGASLPKCSFICQQQWFDFDSLTEAKLQRFTKQKHVQKAAKQCKIATTKRPAKFVSFLLRMCDFQGEDECLVCQSCSEYHQILSVIVKDGKTYIVFNASVPVKNNLLKSSLTQLFGKPTKTRFIAEKDFIS